MKIITTTMDDFVKNEIEEHGHDYVEAQFIIGYEPVSINGVWCWGSKTDVLSRLSSTAISSNTVSSRVDHSRNRVWLLVR